jgi:hypothetical protein
MSYSTNCPPTPVAPVWRHLPADPLWWALILFASTIALGAALHREARLQRQQPLRSRRERRRFRYPRWVA